MQNIKIVTGLDSEEQKYIGDKLSQFNKDSAPSDYKKHRINVDLALKDESGNLVGGLIGMIYRHCLFIDTLWIDESLRGLGYGKELVKNAEQTARENACVFIHLDTFSFQAPDFYERLGFEVFGVLDEYPGELKRYYMKKMLK